MTAIVCLSANDQCVINEVSRGNLNVFCSVKAKGDWLLIICPCCDIDTTWLLGEYVNNNLWAQTSPLGEVKLYGHASAFHTWVKCQYSYRIGDRHKVIIKQKNVIIWNIIHIIFRCCNIYNISSTKWADDNNHHTIMKFH